MSNKAYNNAKINKNDEYYTQLHDIENELKHYVKHFKDKVVYCNCDDPEYSNFYFFFKEQFNWYGLKKLITTHYEKDSSKQSFKIEITSRGDKLQETKTPLQSNGDFRSNECIELLKESDIVVTNPPFSLFREYIRLLINSNKQFLIIGPISILGHQETFNYFKNNQMWLGYGFHKTPTFYAKVNNSIDKNTSFTSPCYWYTNLEHSKRNEELILWKTYNKDEYPNYINYKAINVNKTIEIPKNYQGLMGVPITFLDKWNPNQFELIGLDNGNINYQIIKSHKLEILKNNKPTGKFITNPKGTLYILCNNNPKKAFFKDEQNNYYQKLYARIIIKNKMLNK